MNETLPLSGLKVIELGSSLAGPSAAETLALLGADVVKVEPPEGDASRTWGSSVANGGGIGYQSVNREKRSITIDFSDDEQLNKLKALIDKSDILLQNLRPGVTKKFGFDPRSAMATNPTLIYCNINSYGTKGPLKEQPGYDPLMQGFSGMMSITGESDRPPSRVGPSVIDLGAGMWSVIGILSALHQSKQSGKGMVVDSSLMETALHWMKFPIAEYLESGKLLQRNGNKGPGLVPNRGFATLDGDLMITVGTNGQFKNFCRALEQPDWLDDERFATNNSRTENFVELEQRIEKVLKTQPRETWIERLSRVNVPNSPIHTIDEVVKHPQVTDVGLIQSSPDNSQQLVGLPLSFDQQRPTFKRQPPKLGEHNEEVFQQWLGES